MEAPSRAHEDASTRWGPARLSRLRSSWLVIIRTRQRAATLASSGCERRAQRLPAPESEARQVDAFAAAAELAHKGGRLRATPGGPDENDRSTVLPPAGLTRPAPRPNIDGTYKQKARRDFSQRAP